MDLQSDPGLPFLRGKGAWGRGYRVTGQATVKERRVPGEKNVLELFAGRLKTSQSV